MAYFMLRKDSGSSQHFPKVNIPPVVPNQQIPIKRVDQPPPKRMKKLHSKTRKTKKFVRPKGDIETTTSHGISGTGDQSLVNSHQVYSS